MIVISPTAARLNDAPCCSDPALTMGLLRWLSAPEDRSDVLALACHVTCGRARELRFTNR